jgi:hypothetical protein
LPAAAALSTPGIWEKRNNPFVEIVWIFDEEFRHRLASIDATSAVVFAVALP